MRTTIDLPDALFREAKAAAASQGESLKALLTRAVEAVVRREQAARARITIPLFGDPSGPKARLMNEDLARIEADEDVGYARRTSV